MRAGWGARRAKAVTPAQRGVSGPRVRQTASERRAGAGAPRRLGSAQHRARRRPPARGVAVRWRQPGSRVPRGAGARAEQGFQFLPAPTPRRPAAPRLARRVAPRRRVERAARPWRWRAGPEGAGRRRPNPDGREGVAAGLGPRVSYLAVENREDILNASDKLTEVLEEANTLFNGGSPPCCVASVHMVARAGTRGLTHMGVNPLEAEELIRDEDSSDFEFIVYDSWKISGKTAENTFNKTHTFHFLLGSIQGEFPVPKPRSDRPRKGPTTEEKKTMPDQLSEMEESHQEATEKEVERILGLLQTYFREDPDTPMSFFDFVVDPHSFPRTVENIFHVSFIIRDGFARIKLDQDRLPIIEPVNINEESEGIDQNTQIRNQGIIALSYRDWEEIVKTFEISEPVIASGQSQQRLSA
ncbi:non-structural maintenance of chromosomes element 4 homolog A [Puma concolor]|uniref:Non-structural maintenance of chromosomes element 4 n=1 Tax=Puma concolor TaxID=9696 RepID=A0A6P6HEC8_PUMCO|nr:non-structural maintenance of chromosomes element 4 homolog A [Puma concolor]